MAAMWRTLFPVNCCFCCRTAGMPGEATFREIGMPGTLETPQCYVHVSRSSMIFGQDDAAFRSPVTDKSANEPFGIGTAAQTPAPPRGGAPETSPWPIVGFTAFPPACCRGGGLRRPRIPVSESALWSRPCVARSSAQMRSSVAGKSRRRAVFLYRRARTRAITVLVFLVSA
jgi:hypothetical protein